MLNKYSVAAVLIIVALIFQNCGPGFQAESPIPGTIYLKSLQGSSSISLPAGENWALVLNENFDGNGSMASSKLFEFDTMDDALNRVGNSNMDDNGNVRDGVSVKGKRWSAWYNKFNDETAFRENGQLIMGGKLTNEADPTRRVNYVDKGVTVKYGENKLYTSWLQSWSRKYNNELEKHTVDPASNNKTYKYGFFEAKVDFSEMRTPGFRLSIWLMPAARDRAGLDTVESNAYNDDGNDGIEIDIFEYEYSDALFKNRIIMAAYGGAAGNTSTVVDPSTSNINLEQGTHKIGFLWEEDKMIWYINGIEFKRETNADLIPDVYSYLIISREINSGVVKPDQKKGDDVVEVKPHIPYDYGLYAENTWLYKDRIDTDRGKIDYIRVWQNQ